MNLRSHENIKEFESSRRLQEKWLFYVAELSGTRTVRGRVGFSIDGPPVGLEPGQAQTSQWAQVGLRCGR